MISVVIATYNRADMVTKCVRAVLAGSVTPLEIVVVDQSEYDETEQALQALGQPTVRHVRHHPPSTSAARNLGLRAARGDYAAILDDDVEVPPGWLASLREELTRRPHLDALFGELRPPASIEDDAIPVSVFTLEAPSSWSARTFPDRLGFSAHMLVRRPVFEALGGFDERLGPGTPFFAAEDMDLNYRLLKGGHDVVSTPAVWATHHQWRRPHDLPELYYRYGVGQAAFCAKHLRTGDAFVAWILLRHLAGDVRMVASAARRRSRLRARVAWARWRGTAHGLASGWRAFRAG